MQSADKCDQTTTCSTAELESQEEGEVHSGQVTCQLLSLYCGNLSGGGWTGLLPPPPPPAMIHQYKPSPHPHTLPGTQQWYSVSVDSFGVLIITNYSQPRPLLCPLPVPGLSTKLRGQRERERERELRNENWQFYGQREREREDGQPRDLMVTQSSALPNCDCDSSKIVNLTLLWS